MVRQVFAGLFQQSKVYSGFDFGSCLFYQLDGSVIRGEEGWSGMPGEEDQRAFLSLLSKIVKYNKIK